MSVEFWSGLLVGGVIGWVLNDRLIIKRRPEWTKKQE